MASNSPAVSRDPLTRAGMAHKINDHEYLRSFPGLSMGALVRHAGIASIVCFPSANATKNSCALNPGAGCFLFRAACTARAYDPSRCSTRDFTVSASYAFRIS